ncbi:hypothetical protein M1512_01980 [Patescibacteria group bacterium]|nr:hypothetical protein [Patescibacteria group bacterium]
MENAPKLFNKRMKLALVVLGLMIAAYVIYFAYGKLVFSVEYTNPPSNDVATLTPFFDIYFNKTLTNKGLSVSMSPADFYGKKYYINGDSLIVSLSVPMQARHKYTITVNNVDAEDGQMLKNLVFTFYPTPKTMAQLPEDQSEALTARNEASPVYKNPILKHLPYSTIDFNLSASFPTGKNDLPSLVLIAKLNIPAAVTGELQQQTISQYEQEIASYISSFGLNPASYHIDYIVSNS